jgi:hypothetical protein
MANWVFQTGWLFVIGCWAPDHKRNDCELMFACFSVLRTKIQTIPLIERYGHWHAPGFTRNDRGTSRPCLLPPTALKSKPPALQVVVDSARQQLSGKFTNVFFAGGITVVVAHGYIL